MQFLSRLPDANSRKPISAGSDRISSGITSDTSQRPSPRRIIAECRENCPSRIGTKKTSSSSISDQKLESSPPSITATRNRCCTSARWWTLKISPSRISAPLRVGHERGSTSGQAATEGAQLSQLRGCPCRPLLQHCRYDCLRRLPFHP